MAPIGKSWLITPSIISVGVPYRYDIHNHRPAPILFKRNEKK